MAFIDAVYVITFYWPYREEYYNIPAQPLENAIAITFQGHKTQRAWRPQQWYNSINMKKCSTVASNILKGLNERYTIYSSWQKLDEVSFNSTLDLYHACYEETEARLLGTRAIYLIPLKCLMETVVYPYGMTYILWQVFWDVRQVMQQQKWSVISWTWMLRKSHSDSVASADYSVSFW